MRAPRLWFVVFAVWLGSVAALVETAVRLVRGMTSP